MRDPQTDLEVCEKATWGKWIKSGSGVDFLIEDDCLPKPYQGEICLSPENCNSKNDMKFIALAREALPHWINRVQELEAENKRLRVKCKNAEKLPNGQCRGFQVSHFDDEPIEQCKKCQKFQLYEAEAENWDEEGEHDD